MLFTTPIDKVVPTDKGHTIEFKKGVPTHVPKECWKDVQAAGAVPIDQEKLAEMQAAKKKEEEEQDVEKRTEKVHEAFTKMIARNKRGDFTASGAPHVKIVEELVGVRLDAKERDKLWTDFQQSGGVQAAT